MGLIDFINKFKKTKPNINYAKMLNGYTPIFSQFGQDIYASDVVQQAIACLVTELTKANPFHIKQSGSDLVPVENSEIQKLLDQPNERMTQTDFFEKVYWQLFLNYNSFIIPTYYKDIKGNKHYTGLYPIQPTNVTFLQDPEGKLGIEFTFRLLQGVAKALKSSFSINGVIKYNTLMDDGKMENNIKEIEKRLANNESGFLPLDIKGEYIPLQNKIQLVDATTLKFIDEKILRNIGVSLPILTGDYTKAQYEAFYQKSLEPILKRTGESFTMTMFTNREKGFKNKVMMYPHELIFMDTSQKIELFDVLVDSASCYKNELRTAFGMRPLPELAGQIAMSSNKANAENNKIKKDGGNKNEE